MLGHAYPPAYLANPKNWRTRCSLLVEGPEGNLLVDCAPEMRLQLVREGILDVAAVLITHTHADHVMGMDDLRSLCVKTGGAMPVYTLPRYQEDIRRIYRYAFQEFPPGIWVPRFDLIDVPPVLTVAGMKVQTFVVEHGPLPCIGIRIGDFAYITDVSRIPEDVFGLLEGLNTLVLDAVRYAPHPNHFNLEGALAVAARISAGQTYLTHLSHDYDHDEFEASLPTGVAPAFDGMRITISL